MDQQMTEGPMKEQLLEKKLVKQKQISRVYNPVSSDLIQKTMAIKVPFAKRDTNRIREIVFIGRLDPQKNLPHLIEAFALLSHKMPEIHLRLIGTGVLTESIMKMVEDNGLSERVSFDGIYKNMENVYAKADMIVLSSEYEGMPNCLIEAIGCGIPIVSYDCPIGPREIVVDDVNGYLVKYNDINEIRRDTVVPIRDRYEPYFEKRENLFQIISCFQIVSTQTGKVFLSWMSVMVILILSFIKGFSPCAHCSFMGIRIYVKVGNNVKIGANCVVVEDIPDNATVVLNKPRIIIR